MNSMDEKLLCGTYLYCINNCNMYFVIECQHYRFKREAFTKDFDIVHSNETMHKGLFGYLIGIKKRR